MPIPLLLALVWEPAPTGAQQAPTGVRPVPFVELSDVRSWPGPVQSWIAENLRVATRLPGVTELLGTPKAGVVHDGPYTYLIGYGGERPSSGYKLRFTEVIHAGDRVVAEAEVAHVGGVVLDVLIYPLAVVRIERTDLPVEIRGYGASGR